MTSTTQTSLRAGWLSQIRDYLNRESTQEALVDVGVYALALGALYVSYGTVVKVAMTMTDGFSSRPAHIVGGLADLAILVFARKADLAARAGRRAPALRLVVLLMSAATVLLNVRTSWPHLVPVTLHLLPPLVWIIAQEAMLHGKRLAYHARRRAEQISKGLRPAEVAHLSWHQVVLSPRRNLQRLRVMWLTSSRADEAAAYLVQRWNDNPKKANTPVPLAWTALASGRPIAPPRRTLAIPLANPQPPMPIGSVPHPTGLAGKQLAKLDTALQLLLMDAVTPYEAGHPLADAVAAADRVEQVCNANGIKATGVLLAELLGCTPPYVSKINAERKTLTPANP